MLGETTAINNYRHCMAAPIFRRPVFIVLQSYNEDLVSCCHLVAMHALATTHNSAGRNNDLTTPMFAPPPPLQLDITVTDTILVCESLFTTNLAQE